jgi:hypothetical protein
MENDSDAVIHRVTTHYLFSGILLTQYDILNKNTCA